MKNVKVKLKLILSFSIVIMLTIVVAIVGIIGMSSINFAGNDLYNHNVNAMETLGSIRENFVSQERDFRILIIRDSSTERYKTVRQRIGSQQAAMKEYIAKYIPTMHEQEDKDLFDRFLKAYEVYEQALSDMMRLTDQNIVDETLSILDNTGTPASNEVLDILLQCYEFNIKDAKNTVDNNAGLFKIVTVAQIAVLIAAVAVAMFLGVYISGIISKPLVALTEFMNKAGTTGDISLTQEDTDTIEMLTQAKDEIGQCIGATADFVKHVTNVSNQLEAIASGDLTTDVSLLSERDTIGLSLKKMIDNLNFMFSEIHTASAQVSSGITLVSQGAQELASGSSEQSANIQEFSALLAELQDKTNRNADKSVKAQEANSKAAMGLEGSIRSMGDMLEAMKGIDESSQSITRVIKVIDDIAFQTNILALNAAVEAARAGQHGKGFAVVADEVRNLAAKSAEAAQETATLIEGSSAKVKRGNEIVAKTNADLEASAKNARESTRLIEQVAAESTDQAKSITEINEGIEQISGVVHTNSVTAEQSAAAAEEMSAQTVVLNEIVAKFKLKQGSSSKSISPDFAGISGQPTQNYVQRDASGFAISGNKY